MQDIQLIQYTNFSKILFSLRFCEWMPLTLDMHRVINCLHCMQNWNENKNQQLFSSVAIALVCVVFIISCISWVSVIVFRCISYSLPVNDTTAKSQKPMELIWSLARAVTTSMYTKNNIRTHAYNSVQMHELRKCTKTKTHKQTANERTKHTSALRRREHCKKK